MTPSSGTVLVALDGSSFAETALGHARVVARALGSRLHLVRVLDPSRSGGTAARSAECRLQTIEARSYLERLVRELKEVGFDASLEVREGDPVSEIVAAALVRDVDLVVVAARPRRGDERLVSPGIAQGVIASGAVSLLVARGNREGRCRGRGDPRYRRIAVAVDGSPGSHRALRLAASVARREGARLVLVHVVSAGKAGPPGRKSEREDGAVVDRLAAAGRYLRELGRREAWPEVAVDTVLCRVNGVSDTLEDAAREARADLLVVGARGAGRASSRYGRCARRLLLHSEVPILVVRGDARATARTGGPGALRKRRPRGHIRGGRRDEAPATAGASGGTNEERARP